MYFSGDALTTYHNGQPFSYIAYFCRLIQQKTYIFQATF